MNELKKGYTHCERQIGKSTYPDDGIELGHSHLLSPFHCLSNLLLVLRDTRTDIPTLHLGAFIWQHFRAHLKH